MTVSPNESVERTGTSRLARCQLQRQRWLICVAHLGCSLRREVASITAERGLFLTQPCLSREVFYGSRRLAGGASHCQGSGASQTMQSTWEPQSGATLESDGMVKIYEHSQASSPRTSHTRLIKAWAKMARGQDRALERGPTRTLHRRCTEWT